MLFSYHCKAKNFLSQTIISWGPSVLLPPYAWIRIKIKNTQVELQA